MKRDLPLTKLFDDRDYWTPLWADIRSARGALVVQSPFISQKRMERLMHEIEAVIRRDVVVTVVLQQPRDKEQPGEHSQKDRYVVDGERLESLISWLTSCGAHVEVRQRIHAKFVLVDEDILWEGSLNLLSHYDTTEHLRRSINRKEVREVRDRHKLNNIPSYGNSALGTDRFGKLLVQRRKECGISQTQCARDIRTDASEVSRLERGARKPLNDVFAKMLEYLDMRIVLVPAYLAGKVEKFVEKELSGIPVSSGDPKRQSKPAQTKPSR